MRTMSPGATPACSNASITPSRPNSRWNCRRARQLPRSTTSSMRSATAHLTANSPASPATLIPLGRSILGTTGRSFLSSISCGTRIATRRISSWTPSPVTAAIASGDSPAAAANACRCCSYRSRASGTSIFVTATTNGFSARPAPYDVTSLRIIRYSSTRSLASPSTRWISTCARSQWRRNSSPKPRPSCAPSIKPGTSNITSARSPTCATPNPGSNVVNG